MTLKDILPYIYGVTSNISFVIMQVFFKMLARVIPTAVILSFRSFFLLSLNSYMLVSNPKYKKTYQDYKTSNTNNEIQIKQHYQIQDSNRYELNIKDRKVFKSILIRVFFNCLSIWLFNTSLKYIPLSIANALVNTAPVLVFFLQAYFYNTKLQKPLKKIHFILTVISFIGVLLIINPSKMISQWKSDKNDEDNSFYILMCLTGAITTSLGFIFMHELKGKVNQFIALEYGYIFQTIYFHFICNFQVLNNNEVQYDSQKAYFQPSIFDPYCVGAFILVVLLSYLAHYFRVKSLFRLPPSKITPFNYVGIILALVIDLTLFGHKTNIFQLLGILLTSIGLLSQLFLSLQEQKLKSINNQTTKQIN